MISNPIFLEPEELGNYHIVVVYGKRYFLKKSEALSWKEMPHISTLPTRESLKEMIKLLLKRGV